MSQDDIKIHISTTGQGSANKGLGAVRKGLKSIGAAAKRVAIAAAAVGTATVGAVAALGRMAQAGGKILNVQRAFSRVTGNSAGALRELREATHGLIKNYDLMTGYNRALALGSAENVEQYGELAKTALALGRALGEDAAYALESLNLGIGRQSKLFLDNLGIVLSVEQANKKYARSLGVTVEQLSEAQKKEAFRTAALEAARRKVAQLGGVQETAADSVKRLYVNLGNFKDRLLALVARSPHVQRFFESMGGIVENLATSLSGSRGDIQQAFGLIGEIAGKAFAIAFTRSTTFLVDKWIELLIKGMEKIPVIGRLATAGPGGMGMERLQGLLDDVNDKTTEWAAGIASAAAELDELTDSIRENNAQRDPAAAAPAAGAPPATGTARSTWRPPLVTPAGPPIQQAPAGVGQLLETTIANRRAAAAYELQSNAAELAKQRTQEMAVTVIGAFTHMAQAAQQGSRGMLGSLVGGVAGVLAAVPGVGTVASAGILAGGGLLARLAGGGRGPLPVKLDSYSSTALQQRSRREGPDQITVQILSPSTGELLDEIIYEIGRRERRDAIVRIPGLGGG